MYSRCLEIITDWMYARIVYYLMMITYYACSLCLERQKSAWQKEIKPLQMISTKRQFLSLKLRKYKYSVMRRNMQTSGKRHPATRLYCATLGSTMEMIMCCWLLWPWTQMLETSPHCWPPSMNNGMIRSEVRRKDKDSHPKINLQDTKILLFFWFCLLFWLDYL